MRIQKSGECRTESAAEGLAAINALAKRELSADEVYCFSVLLCDNEVDRDFERFTEATLEELRELFIGKTGIFDHDWSAKGQRARIYATELVRDPARKTSLGTPYTYLKGLAYMLRTEENAALIAEIEGGIKKETSVGCSVEKSLCSICGEELGSCGHIRGQEYGGRLCFAELSGALDAYEWSFVAVPAQRGAGVMKRFDLSRGLAGFVESEEGRVFEKELLSLRKEAALGKKYLSLLQKEALRLSLLCDRKLHEALSASVPQMEEEGLISLCKALDAQLAERFPPRTQLPGRRETARLSGDEDKYKI